MRQNWHIARETGFQKLTRKTPNHCIAKQLLFRNSDVNNYFQNSTCYRVGQRVRQSASRTSLSRFRKISITYLAIPKRTMTSQNRTRSTNHDDAKFNGAKVQLRNFLRDTPHSKWFPLVVKDSEGWQQMIDWHRPVPYLYYFGKVGKCQLRRNLF